MATVADNIEGMAALASGIKQKYRLSETTVVRLIEINLAYANQQQQANPFEEEPLPFPEIIGPDDTFEEDMGITAPELEAVIEPISAEQE